MMSHKFLLKHLSVNAGLLKKLDSYGQLENDLNCDDDMQKKETLLFTRSSFKKQ